MMLFEEKIERVVTACDRVSGTGGFFSGSLEVPICHLKKAFR